MIKGELEQQQSLKLAVVNELFTRKKWKSKPPIITRCMVSISVKYKNRMAKKTQIQNDKITINFSYVVFKYLSNVIYLQ